MSDVVAYLITLSLEMKDKPRKFHWRKLDSVLRLIYN